MPLTLPTASFSAAQTIFGAKVIVDFTPTGGAVTHIACKLVDLANKSATVERHVPGTDMVSRPDRQATKEASETFELVDIEEIDAVLTFMTSFSAKNQTGVATIWVIDQNDNTATSVRLKSEVGFKASLKVKDGTTKFGGGDFSKVSLTLLSLADHGIVFTPNASTA
jgi:hypothetical protein